MDIRLLEKGDTEQAKALWKAAFDESDSFTNFYFDNKILHGNSLGMFESGDLVTVLHMIPYKIRVQGRALQTAFIAGAATAKHKRKQGLMKQLLYESLVLMKSRDILMTHLHPFLHSFYEQYGWATYSYVDKIIKTKGKKSDSVIETSDIGILHAMYQNITKGMAGYVIRGEKEWRWRLGELFADGGKAVMLLSEDVPVCYMLYYEVDGEAHVIETVYENPEHAKVLAEHLAADHDKVKYNLLSQSVKSAQHGMVRVVDTEGLLREFDAQNILDIATVKDDFAEWNNVGSGSYEMDIKELARLIHMGPDRVFEERNDVMEELQNIDIKSSFTCIFEEC